MYIALLIQADVSREQFPADRYVAISLVGYMTTFGRSDEHGATMVEHAVALPLFLIILACSFEMFRIGYLAVTTQFIASRYVRDVSIDLASVETVEDLRSALADSLEQYGVSLNPQDEVRYCRIDDFGTASCPPETVVKGSARALMVLSIEKPIEGVLIPGLHRIGMRVRAEVLVRHEPK